MSKQLKIAHIASEVEPFSKTGGLANVLGSLPRAHKELGHDAIIITPFYEQIINPEYFQHLRILGEAEKIELTQEIFEEVAYFEYSVPDEPVVYFVSNKRFFGNRAAIYGSPEENMRFMFFDVAALHLLKKIDFQPDIINCHDWQTGLIPYFLKGRYRKDLFWEKTATLFTIHNLTFQLGRNWWEISTEERDDGRTPLPPFGDEELGKINFAKRAIMNADAINAVSETYREEIMTKDFGQELHRILKNREKIVFGIVNGIDYNEFNPLTDPGLHRHYSYKSVGLKKYNKKWLQRYYKLTVDPDVPLICMTSRISEQKGFRLVVNILKVLLRFNVQMIVMGDGDKEILSMLQKVQKEFPKQFAVVPFDVDRETSLYAGSDIFLLPSRFEPCGINQMIALRYGSVPVVHHIGGLADTIVDYDPRTKKGNGFTFSRYSATSLLIALIRAIETYKHKRAWKELVIRSLREANSWVIPAQKYIDLYRTTMTLKKRHDRKEKRIKAQK